MKGWESIGGRGKGRDWDATALYLLETQSNADTAEIKITVTSAPLYLYLNPHLELADGRSIEALPYCLLLLLLLLLLYPESSSSNQLDELISISNLTSYQFVQFDLIGETG